jgi:tetratricopeptide (TPR) repeat protein
MGADAGSSAKHETLKVVRTRIFRFWLLTICAHAAWADGRPSREEALALYTARNYSAARVAFGALARELPEDPEIEFHLGRLALWFDDGGEALARLEKIATRIPGDARVQNALGDAYGLAAQKAGLLAKLGWARKCRAAYERAVALAPREPAYRWSLLGFYLVAPGIAGGCRDSALAQAVAIEKLDPVHGRIARATVYLADRNYDAAFGVFEPEMRRVPDDFLASYHFGRCAAVSGERLADGLAALRRCLHLRPPPGDGLPTLAHVHHRIGMILEKQGRVAEAAAAYAAAKREDPDFNAAKTALKS